MTTVSTEDKLLKRLDSKIKKAIFDYSLISDGDKILIGLSGGKDSIALMELLGQRMRIFKPKFSLVAAHIVMSNVPYASDADYLNRLAENFNIPLLIHETSFDLSTDKRKTPCFLCSWTRRKALFDIAKSQGCNKIALGHHKDDIIETLLMNITQQGAFSTMPPKLVMQKFDMEIIRPMCLIEEKDLVQLSRIREYKPQKALCPYEKKSSRAEFKKILGELEKLNPDVRGSIWSSMNNVQADYLPTKTTKHS